MVNAFLNKAEGMQRIEEGKTVILQASADRTGVGS